MIEIVLIAEKNTQILFFFYQYYCKKCLSRYIADTSDSSTCLDMCVYTINSGCNVHKMSRNEESLVQSVQDWCENCSGILYFKQIYPGYYNYIYYSAQKDIK